MVKAMGTDEQRMSNEEGKACNQDNIEQNSNT